MSFVENIINQRDLNQAQEICYHLSELEYHQENIRLALQEADYHLKKFQYHDSLINELTNNFNEECLHVS